MREIIDRICSSNLSDSEALEVLRRAYRRDHRIELLLIQRAKDDPRWLMRVLRLLVAVSDGQRTVAALLPVLESTEASVRELAALLIARGQKNPTWAREMMNDSDPRVRANVIEGVRARNRDIHLLNKAIRDPHHRVVCNAIVSLYGCRPARARILLEKQLTHADWQFRAAATWACGAIGDAALEELITRMRQDPHPSVRWNALRAASALRRSTDRTDGEGDHSAVAA
jgi:HEAT repeat protein